MAGGIPSIGSSRFRASRGFTADSPAVGAGAILGLCDAAHVIGLDEDTVLHALGTTRERLEQRGARVSWNMMVTALENLERAGASPANFTQLGEAMTASPHLRVQRIASFFIRPEHLVYASLRWVGPALFPLLDHTLVYRGRELELTLQIPNHLPPSAAYMNVCVGTMRAVPTVVGHPAADVVSELSERRGHFQIRCHRRPTTARRVLRVARSLLSTRNVVAALTEQESELRESLETVARWERQFGDILDALPDGVMLVRGSAPAHVVYVNPALVSMLGYRHPHELLGRTHVSLVHPEDRDPQLTEVRLARADGAWAATELSAPRLIEFDGEPAALRVVRDTTLRRRLQDHMADADKGVTLSTLAAGIAHELNNPLALVLASLELHARRHGSSHELASALEGARRASGIVRDLRDFSRPDEHDRHLVDLADVVRSSIVLAAGRLRARAIVDTRLAEVAPVLGHRGRLGQVVLNLLINAADAFPEDQTAADNRITVRLAQEGDHAIIEVEDNAGGIDPAHLDRLFEPFFTTKPPGMGTGLGLPVSKGIVVDAGGSIDVLSSRHGSTFRIRLPTAPHNADLPGELEPDAPRRTRVLLVDDECSLVTALRVGLELAGHEVVTASSGNRAIATIEDDPDFDAVVCDIAMPDGTGVDVFEYLGRAKPGLADRLIFITGGSTDPEVRAFLATVPNRCIDKPFLLRELEAAIAEVIPRP